MAIFKLAVSDRIEFDVKFSLNDGGIEKTFGVKLSALRQKREDLQRDMSELVEHDDPAKYRKYLDGRGLRMLNWIGRPLLVAEDNTPVPAGDEALAALCDLVGGVEVMIFKGYLQASTSKDKSGN